MVLNMSSKRSHEGYLLMDHRAGDPVPDELVRDADLPPGAGRGLFEAATYTCSHCQFVVVIEPKRTRERAYCRRCDHFICDGCGAIYAQNKICKTFKQIVEETLEAAEKQAVSVPIILLPT